MIWKPHNIPKVLQKEEDINNIIYKKVYFWIYSIVSLGNILRK